MKNLVIVESPAKSKTIEKYLGKDYKVVSSVGHIRDLATRGKEGLGVDVEHNFEPTYVISKEKKDVVTSLKKDVAKAQTVYLATDPDREGEAISWHLAPSRLMSITERKFSMSTQARLCSPRSTTKALWSVAHAVARALVASARCRYSRAVATFFPPRPFISATRSKTTIGALAAKSRLKTTSTFKFPTLFSTSRNMNVPL